MIERKEYLEKLKKWKDKDLIKVITGINFIWYIYWLFKKYRNRR